MDFVGQKLAESLILWVVLLGALVGFLLGYTLESYKTMMQVYALGCVLAAIVRSLFFFCVFVFVFLFCLVWFWFGLLTSNFTLHTTHVCMYVHTHLMHAARAARLVLLQPKPSHVAAIHSKARRATAKGQKGGESDDRRRGVECYCSRREKK